nr:type II toxin-antitoxin system RelE/ParE family toxin [Paracoccus aestuarii]
MDDLEQIAGWIADYAGASAAAAKLAEIEAVILSLSEVSHKGDLRDEITPGRRAIPAGRKSVIVFKVEDGAREVLIYAVTHGGPTGSREVDLGDDEWQSLCGSGSPCRVGEIECPRHYGTVSNARPRNQS